MIGSITPSGCRPTAASKTFNAAMSLGPKLPVDGDTIAELVEQILRGLDGLARVALAQREALHQLAPGDRPDEAIHRLAQLDLHIACTATSVWRPENAVGHDRAAVITQQTLQGEDLRRAAIAAT